MATVNSFQTRFPEFCDEDDSRIQMFLTDAANTMTDPSRWGTKYDIAQEYLTAHFVYVALASETGDGDALAPLRKQDVDGVVVEQAVSDIDPNTDDYYSTTYGKRFMLIARPYFAGPRGV